MNTPAYLTLSDEIWNNLYDLRKAQDTVRYLLAKTVGVNGLMPAEKLGGLLYVVEREFFKRYGEPLMGDILIRSQNTFTLQKTQSWLKGEEFGYEGVVEIQPDMSLKVVFPESTMNHHGVETMELNRAKSFFKRETHLSDADIDVLDFVLLNFMHMTANELSDYMAHQFAETANAAQNTTIAHTALLQALSYDSNQINSILEHMEEMACLNMAFHHF